MRFGSTGCQLSTLPFYFYIFSENAQVGCDQRPPPFGGRRTHGTDRGLSIYVVGLSACSHCTYKSDLYRTPENHRGRSYAAIAGQA